MKIGFHIFRACLVMFSVVSICSATGQLPQKLLGSLSGEMYTSPSGRFTIKIPEMMNPFHDTVPMILDKTDIPSAMEQVSFTIWDIGEVYSIGVRTIPHEFLPELDKTETQTVLARMAKITLESWRPFPEKPAIFENKFVSTHLGEGIVTIFLAPKGSLLTSAMNRQPRAAETFDTLIAVMCVRRGDQHLFAIAEFDGMMDGLTGLKAPGDNAKIADQLTKQITRIFGTLRSNP